MANKAKYIIADSKNKTYFKTSINKIQQYFKSSTKKAFSKENLNSLFEEKNSLWKLPVSYTPEKFIEQLIKKEILKKIEIPIERYIGKRELFISDDAPIFQIANSLIPKSYLSHYSAVFLNGLTTQIPKIIYITFEQSKKHNVNRELEQRNIDDAFTKPQRQGLAKGVYNGYTFFVHNAMFYNKVGVYTQDDVQLTNLERTLIDITVRPNYAGGVNAVLDAYKKSIDAISINKLLATLEKMNFIYPYHQAIAFYLERSGIEKNKLREFEELSMDYNFYLTYEMKETEYSTKWKLYYPKGM